MMPNGQAERSALRFAEDVAWAVAVGDLNSKRSIDPSRATLRGRAVPTLLALSSLYGLRTSFLHCGLLIDSRVPVPQALKAPHTVSVGPSSFPLMVVSEDRFACSSVGRLCRPRGRVRVRRAPNVPNPIKTLNHGRLVCAVDTLRTSWLQWIRSPPTHRFHWILIAGWARRGLLAIATGVREGSRRRHRSRRLLTYGWQQLTNPAYTHQHTHR